jgi:hypothetical protein
MFSALTQLLFHTVLLAVGVAIVASLGEKPKLPPR